MLLIDRLHYIHGNVEIIRVLDADYAVVLKPDFGAWISHVTLFTQLIQLNFITTYQPLL